MAIPQTSLPSITNHMSILCQSSNLWPIHNSIDNTSARDTARRLGLDQCKTNQTTPSPFNPIWYQSITNPPIQCQSITNLPVQCQSWTNTSSHCFDKLMNMINPMPQSSKNGSTQVRHALAQITPILYQSEASCACDLRSDASPSSIPCQSVANPVPIRCQSCTNPILIRPLMCQSVFNPMPIWRQSKANPESINANPVPIHPQSDVNPSNCVWILGQSSTNPLPIHRQ